MPSKKASTTGAAALQPLDPNQETLSLREARSQKRKATSPTLQEEELDQEIRNMEMLHEQVQRKKEKMARQVQQVSERPEYTKTELICACLRVAKANIKQNSKNKGGAAPG
jgi:RecA-family ATPase